MGELMISEGTTPSAGRSLTLVRHSLTKLDLDLPPQMWKLTDEGRDRCNPLADRLATLKLGVIITSKEPKARETGEIVAQRLHLTCNTAKDLHEHRREGGRILSQTEFSAQIAALFAHPEQLIFGLETAAQALTRFTEAVHSAMADYPNQNVAIVSHGTVMSLFYGALTGMDAYLFWRGLGLPSFYTVSWPDRIVLSQVMQIAP